MGSILCAHVYDCVLSQVKKQEAEKLCNCNKLTIPIIQYSLTPTQTQLQIPIVTVMVSGANKKLSYILTAQPSPSSHGK